ncbi:hypothetical protein C8J56DRAFT_1015277 [Mycena floridula]|nr:hypothetical protein C8J56DRAFT_1015277 [Mycena floridula]
MLTDEIQEDARTPTELAAMATTRKRPRLVDLSSGERKKGKSVFGILLGTLNKAKNEDKERNASDAAKKRQLIEQRLQNKLRKETDSVRRAEEAKKDKTAANRREEELQLKDSICKLRRKRLPLLAGFLLTSDLVPQDSEEMIPPSSGPQQKELALYYLPAVLTPAQETFLSRRKAEVTAASEIEWSSFLEERATGIAEITQLRLQVAEEEARKKAQASEEEKGDAMDTEEPSAAVDKQVDMDLDEQEKTEGPLSEKKEEHAEYDDDAVEY